MRDALSRYTSTKCENYLVCVYFALLNVFRRHGIYSLFLNTKIYILSYKDAFDLSLTLICITIACYGIDKKYFKFCTFYRDYLHMCDMQGNAKYVSFILEKRLMCQFYILLKMLVN